MLLVVTSFFFPGSLAWLSPQGPELADCEHDHARRMARTFPGRGTLGLACHDDISRAAPAGCKLKLISSRLSVIADLMFRLLFPEKSRRQLTEKWPVVG
jgi:hypothetical protein